MALLRLENVSKYFGKTRALSNINLTIKEGLFCVILGPSGCGKSTLLNLIAGLEESTGGRLYLGDKEITQLPPHKRNIAMVFQSYALYPHLSVFENIAFGLRIKKEENERITQKVKKVSKILNIEDKLDRFPRELSGGEKQRVATGRAIVRDPLLFLFDEPLSNLDARLRVELRAEFIKLHRRLKKTIIYVTHDQIEAMSLGQEVVVLKDGQIQQVSAPKELYYSPQNVFVASFIGSPPMNIIQLEVKKIENKIILKRDGFSIEFRDKYKRAIEGYLDKKVYLGFRPSSARIRKDGEMRGEVVFTETVGEDNYARIKIHPDIEVNVKLSGPFQPEPRDLVSLDLDGALTYLFAPDGKIIND